MALLLFTHFSSRLFHFPFNFSYILFVCFVYFMFLEISTNHTIIILLTRSEDLISAASCSTFRYTFLKGEIWYLPFFCKWFVMYAYTYFDIVYALSRWRFGDSPILKRKLQSCKYRERMVVFQPHEINSIGRCLSKVGRPLTYENDD